MLGQEEEGILDGEDEGETFFRHKGKTTMKVCDSRTFGGPKSNEGNCDVSLTRLPRLRSLGGAST